MTLSRDEAVRRSYLIPGQTWPQELGWLFDELRTSRRHAEVGVFCGRSLFASCAGMGTKREPAIVYAVDLDSPGCDGALPPGETWIGDVQSLTIAAIEQANPGVEIVPAVDSLATARALYREGVRLDSVFIDGSHHYADVVADLGAWAPLLKPGGLLCGHDYWPAHPGVMDAVNELVPSARVVPQSRIWFARI